MKVGDNIVVIKGYRDEIGREGKVTGIGGTCGREQAVHVMLKDKDGWTCTFFPMSHLAIAGGL